MILKKPYAFLIKYFRLIHLILVGLITYIIIKTWGVISFLSEYISKKQSIGAMDKYNASFVSVLLITVIALVIFIISLIYYLLKHKKKPRAAYLTLLIIYPILLIGFLYVSNFIYELQFITPDIRATSLIKDIFYGIFFIQLPILILIIVRAVGFDIKKFDFKKDIMELDISSADNEEFEFQLGLDTEDIKAKIRKQKRYFKYFYKENQIIFVPIYIVVGLFLFINLVSYVITRDVIYKENTTFSTNSYDIKITESFKTKVDNKGNKIKPNKFYIILKITYTNKTDNKLRINLDNAKLSYDNYHDVTPTLLVYENFREFGVPYYSQYIPAKETRNFIFVYELDNSFYDDSFLIKYLYDIKRVNNEIAYMTRKVRLKPKEFKEIEVKETKTYDEELLLKDSLFKNTKISISSVEINKSFDYKVVWCKKGECNNYYYQIKPRLNKVYEMSVMKIKYDIEFDPSLGKNYNMYDFISRYGTVRFFVDGEEYNNKLELYNVAPFPTENVAFVEIRDKVRKAEKIYIDFTIRDKKYSYLVFEKVEEKEDE